MAQISMVPKISLKNEKINSQFRVSSKSLLETQKSVVNINKLLTNRIKVRKDIFSKTIETKRRREFDTRRQELEDEREARGSVVSGAVGNITSTVSKVGGSILGRLVRALGFITAGWILKSLPTWIGYAKEFIARVNELGRIIRSFITNVGNIFQSTGNILKAAKDNILKLDFFDSERNLRNSFSELGSSIEGLQKDFQDTIDVFTTDITKQIDGVQVGSYSGEAIPQPGTGFTEDATTPPTTYDSEPSSEGSGGKSGTKEQRALLDAISFAEGTTKGYGIIFGGANVPELARGELTVKQVYDMMMSGKLNGRNVGYKSGSRATGRYQFMPDTLSDIVKTGAISWDEKFTPEAQDRAILARIASFRGVTPELLRKEGLSARVSNMLAPEFASLPTYSGASYYGQPVKTLKDIQKKYNQSLGTQSQQTQTSSPTKVTSTPQQSALPTNIVQIPPGKIKPVVGDRLGAGRNHGGVDLAVPNGTPLRAISDGVIVDSDYNPGGWGNFLVMKDDRGIYHLYGHMQSGYKRSGPVKKGEVIGKVGMTGRTSGPHLHWEAGSGWNGGVITGRFDPLNKYSQFAPFNTPYSDKPTSQTETQQSPTRQVEVPIKPIETSAAQISSAPTQQKQQAVAQQITPERKPQDIVAVVPPPQQPQQSTASSGSSSQRSSGPSMGELLNNFMKQKFLLDLSFL
jgi:murein DD-endopeptidase MepM/ murein hydrolase activator NlpD